MFQFSWFRFSPPIEFKGEISQYDSWWVSPFGISRITACLRLPETYRCLPRPSSPHLTQSSVHRPFVAWPLKSLDYFCSFTLQDQSLASYEAWDCAPVLKVLCAKLTLLLVCSAQQPWRIRHYEWRKFSKNIESRNSSRNGFILDAPHYLKVHLDYISLWESNRLSYPKDIEISKLRSKLAVQFLC